jgi:hypothetical protein
MSAASVSSILERLDDEIFFAILDVVLDIETELLIGAAPIYIPVRRLAIRYQVLYPVHSVGTMHRYCQLRRKAATFLRTNSFIGAIKYHDQGGMVSWGDLLEVTVPDRSHFADLLVELRIEENRRNPGEKMVADIHSATARLVQLVDSFHRVVLRLRARHANRPPFLVNDEYDVQDLFAALLETRFEDVRREEWGPSYAGGATRVDFFLKNESVLFETKMMRDSLSDRKVGEELIIDIAHYKQRPECKALVCFVYDPDHRLKSPQALENDLSKQDNHLDVRVLIRPRS